MQTIKNTQCRICRSENLKDVIDFGIHPLVNSLIEVEDLDRQDDVFPLIVSQCQDCFLVQITNIVDSDEIYRAQDYLYYTGDMPQESQYMKAFDSLVTELKQLFLSPNDLVVEIGSNDGHILKRFAETYRILGVDPATNVVTRALKNHIPTLATGFDKRVARNIAKEFGKAKVIGGANCLAHIDDIHSVLDGVEELLTDDGVFWVECNYWGGMVQNKHYALIYHDHFSYFTLKNWCDLLKMHGMTVFDAYITQAQGDNLSLRIYASRGDFNEKTNRFHDLYTNEIQSNLNSFDTISRYNKEIREEASKLYNLVTQLKEQGKTIAGYGCAAKGLSVLKFAGIDERHIDYFVDDSPAKQGKYTPVTHIPIISRQEAESELPDYFFITAPNYESVIIAKEGSFVENGGKFITIKSEVK